MSTLIVNIDNKKSEKAIRAVLDALGLNYNIEKDNLTARSLNKSEEVIYSNLKQSVEQIKLYKEAKIELSDARDLLNEL